MSVSVQDQGAAIAAAAAKYNVPLQTLVGVYGEETTYGYGNGTGKTSPTGAIGPFQFEPGTASQYQYPLTNDPNAAEFQAQADAAAHYLSDLYNQLGHSWTNAAAGYNAGPANVSAGAGYAAGIQGAFTNAPKTLINAILNVAGPGAAIGPGTLSVRGGNPLTGVPIVGGLTTGVAAAPGDAKDALTSAANSLGDAVSGPANAIAAIWTWLTTPAKWLEILKFVGGAILVYLGLKSLTGGDQGPIGTAQRGATRVATAV